MSLLIFGALIVEKQKFLFDHLISNVTESLKHQNTIMQLILYPKAILMKKLKQCLQLKLSGLKLGYL